MLRNKNELMLLIFDSLSHFRVWVILNERRLYSNNAKTIRQLLEKIKITSLWLKAKDVCFPFGYHKWWLQPLDCISIG